MNFMKALRDSFGSEACLVREDAMMPPKGLILAGASQDMTSFVEFS
jgi:hypothetical protein